MEGPFGYIATEYLKMTTMDLKELTQLPANSKFPSYQDLSQVSKMALKIKSIQWLKFALKEGLQGNE